MTGTQLVHVEDQSGNKIASGSIDKTNQWAKIESQNDLTGVNVAGVLTIKTPDYTGDIMIDHVLVAPAWTFHNCHKEITLIYP